MDDLMTERLVVRRFAQTDLADFLAYQGQPKVREYMGGEPMTEEQAARFLAKQAAAQGDETGQYHAFAVWHRGDARVIGDVGFFLADGSEEKGDLGFQFHPGYHRQGYAHEAAAALIRHGFLGLGLRRITSGCDARNTASFRLMERLGLLREGHLRQSQVTKGVWHDEYLYALLRDEWLARQGLTPPRVGTESDGRTALRYLRFHKESAFEGALIEEDTIVSYGEAEAAMIDAAAAHYNSRPGESAWPVPSENVDPSLLMTFERAKTLGVIPRQLGTLD